MIARVGRVVAASLLGPRWRGASWRAFGLLLLALGLTALTQVGGVILLLLCPAFAAFRARLGRRPAIASSLVLFVLMYGLLTVTLVPALAALAGRPALPCRASADLPVQAVSPVYCLLNRRYAALPVHRLLDGLARDLARRHPGTVVAYLDAGFPFLNGFPMLPHLSHRRGHDLDLAFFYRPRDGTARPRGGAWPLGYWAYSGPRPGEARPCRSETWRIGLRWDLVALQPLFADLRLDEERTGAMLAWLVANAQTHDMQRILLEPHLKARLGLKSDLIRFQGCRAARHDDHLHVSVE